MTTLLSRTDKDATTSQENPVADFQYAIDPLTISFKASISATQAALLKSETEAAFAASLVFAGPEYDYTFTLQTSKKIIKRVMAYLKNTNKVYGL